MACLGLRYGGAAGDRLLRQPAAGVVDDRCCRSSKLNHRHSLAFPKLAVKSRFPIISTAATVAETAVSVSDRPVSRSDPFVSDASFDIVPVETFVDDEDHDRTSDNVSVSEKIDEWMRDSVTEIVKNINQAPLLVQIYSNGVVKTEKAVEAEDWPAVVAEQPSSPAGVILVEELRDEVDDSDEDNGTKAFGVVIQGRFKGRDRCRSACYLLKTCSVNGGMGLFCTHFCLMKVRSFSKSASSQLSDCWLLP